MQKKLVFASFSGIDGRYSCMYRTWDAKKAGVDMKKKLFIHIPKNAGMTIRSSPIIRPKIILAGEHNHISEEYTKAVFKKMEELNEHHGFEHARWRDCSEDARKHRAFAIIRNPWDRVVSRFFFAKKVIEVEKVATSEYTDTSSFEAFLEERHKWGGKEYMWHRAVRGWYPAFDHVSDEQGNIKCDMLRFERLNQELCTYFGIAIMSKARNVTGLNPGTYKDIYTRKTAQIVADWYKKDIDTWGFDFDTGATRNIVYNGEMFD